MNNELRGELNIITQLQGGILTVPFSIDGVGIETIIFNPDCSMTIVLTDGSSFTSPPLVGPGVAPGGTSGQILSKRSDSDYDTEWVDNTGGSSYVLPPATTEILGGVIVGNDLSITEDGILSVDKANAVQQDNTKPITAAAVYTEVGNINALLATI